LASGGGPGAPPLQPAAGNLCQGAVALRAHKLPRGGTRPSLRLRKAVLAVACIVLVAAGCGEDGGVADGATVSVYVAGPLCTEAKEELARHGARTGDVRVGISCLPKAESNGRLDLAQIGANARHATEDAAAVAYIGEPTRAASRFAEPILETAGIAQLSQTKGAAAMRQLLRAVDEAGSSGSLRESVDDALE
jgi:hypothetical protein